MLGKADGDTLIEVIFAVTVFAMVIVTSLLLMNQGLGSAQRSVQITQVRQQVDAQAESLRYLRDSYVAVYKPGITFTTAAEIASPAGQWSRMMAAATVGSATNFDTIQTCDAVRSEAFVINPRTITYQPVTSVFAAPTSLPAHLNYNSDGSLQSSQGIWVEAVSPASVTGSSTYYDFHIRACWSAPGLGDISRIGTIVRLYVPR